MPDEEESAFTFVDKRRVPQDQPDSPNSTMSNSEPAQAAASDVGGAQSAEPSDPAEHAGGPADHLGAMPRLNVRDRLLMCIDILNQGAWISLGLISDPTTGQVEKDLEQAKAAIDSVAFLSGKVEEELDEETQRELRNLVRDLQLNFVEQSRR
jgi:hypothetical protein